MFTPLGFFGQFLGIPSLGSGGGSVLDPDALLDESDEPILDESDQPVLAEA